MFAAPSRDGARRCRVEDGARVGWAGKTNGELLALAETEFDVFVTIDQNLVQQPGLEGRRLAVVLVVASSNRFDVLAPLVPEMLDALRTIGPGELVRVGG